MIALGSSDMAKAYVGSTEVSKMYLGSELVWEGVVDGHQISQVRMPYYSALNTGYYPNNNTKVKFGVIPQSKYRYGVFCLGRQSDNVNQFSLQYAAEVNQLWYVLGNAGNAVSLDLIPLGYYEIEFSKSTLVVNNNSYSISYSGTFSSPSTLIINGYTVSGSTFDNIYTYFQIYDGDTLVRDYIPWMRSNGTVGMLDRVNNKFYGSSSSVGFTDNTITLPDGFTRLNYISSTGAQRFQTDFTPSGTTNYIAKCRFTGPKSNKTLLSSRTSSTNKRFELMTGDSNSPNVYMYFGYNNGSANNTLANYEGKEFYAIKGMNHIYYYTNNVYEAKNSRTQATFTAPKTLTIGCSNTNGSYATWFVGDIIELDFFSNGHYIPCINPNNIVGMYDVVNGVFKSSETDTPFVAGTVYGQ